MFFAGSRRVNHDVIEVGRGVTAELALENLVNKTLKGSRGARESEGRNQPLVRSQVRLKSRIRLGAWTDSEEVESRNNVDFRYELGLGDISEGILD